MCLIIHNVLLVHGMRVKDYTTTTKPPYSTTGSWSTTTRPPYSTTTGAWTTTSENISFPPEGCPPGWINSQEGCFLFLYSKHVTWREAQLECESLGGFLVEIKSQEQSTLLV